MREMAYNPPNQPFRLTFHMPKGTNSALSRDP
jgi:hypothetical protein